jgi:hypothetical protein
MYFHYEVTSKPTISPLTFGRPDPINEFAQKLKGGSKEDYTLGVKIEPKQRIYVPIIIRGEEDRGVKFWGFGVTIYKELLAKMSNPKWGDITSLTDGRDIEVTFEESKKPGSFPKTTIDVDPERTPLTNDRSILEKLKDMPNLKESYPEPSANELESYLSQYVESGGKSVQTGDAYTQDDAPTNPPAQTSSFRKPEPAVEATSAKAESSSGDDMLAQFQEYLKKK